MNPSPQHGALPKNTLSLFKRFWFGRDTRIKNPQRKEGKEAQKEVSLEPIVAWHYIGDATPCRKRIFTEATATCVQSLHCGHINSKRLSAFNIVILELEHVAWTFEDVGLVDRGPVRLPHGIGDNWCGSADQISCVSTMKNQRKELRSYLEVALGDGRSYERRNFTLP